jgi:hypothetical protein
MSNVEIHEYEAEAVRSLRGRPHVSLAEQVRSRGGDNYGVLQSPVLSAPISEVTASTPTGRPTTAPLDLASPTATPTTTPTARSGCWSRTPDIRSPWPDPTWRPWSPDTRRARNWDIDIEVEVGIDDIRDVNRQPRIDVQGRRWRKFAYNRSEVPVHARRARWWWWLSAADRWRGEFDQRQKCQHDSR